MKTGFSLCHISNREKPVFINWEPCDENRFFPVWKYYTGKTLFWPCSGPVRDCSEEIGELFKRGGGIIQGVILIKEIWCV